MPRARPLRPGLPRQLRRHPRRSGPQGAEPGEETASATVAAARKALAEAEQARQGKLGKLKNPAPGQETVITNAMLAKMNAPVAAAHRTLEEARAAAKAIPAKIPLAEHNPDMARLETETKLITHAVKMAAFNAETALARDPHGRYTRAGDEAYALIREALAAAKTSSPATAPSPSASTR
ncbi:MAG TPA: hypothetical protein VLW50_03705 [Streptosporangiaceae bacterium]|nr:hypothetical protein [Streptosporangiaceae bacterium]